MRFKINFLKIFICIFSISVFSFDKKIFVKPNNINLLFKLKNSLNELHHNDVFDEDIVLKDVYNRCDNLYKKIIEIIVVYYCKNLFLDADPLFDKMLIDISKDAFKIVVLISKYIPLLLKNKKVSLVVKIKKLIIAGFVVSVLIEWLTLFSKKVLKYNNKEIIETNYARNV